MIIKNMSFNLEGHMDLFEKSLQKDMERFFTEDDLHGNFYYLSQLPHDPVLCILKIKSELILSGLPYLVSAFNFLGANLNYSEFEKWEGKTLNSGSEINFTLPFNIALTGERIALNLVQQASKISTFTALYVKKASALNIKILDTRKTTPGLRTLEKYAVRVGGGHNHRMSQCDVFMIKDNHKTFFGSLESAYSFFQSMNAFYNSIVVEIHSINELHKAIDLGIKHVMLDNFSVDDIKSAIKFKKIGMTYEVSGGINLNTITDYLIEGIDVISVGALTHSAPHVDISMKIKKLH